MDHAQSGAAKVAPDLIVTNEHGGRQSNIEGAFHAIPPAILQNLIRRYAKDRRIDALVELGRVLDDKADSLDMALEALYLALYEDANNSKVISAPLASPLSKTIIARGLMKIAEVRAEGIRKYHFNNWRLIGFKSHLDHAIRHILMHLAGDRSEDHLGHAATRVAFAIDVRRTEKYTPFREMPSVHPAAEDHHAAHTPVALVRIDTVQHSSFGKRREVIHRVTPVRKA